MMEGETRERRRSSARAPRRAAESRGARAKGARAARRRETWARQQQRLLRARDLQLQPLPPCRPPLLVLSPRGHHITLSCSASMTDAASRSSPPQRNVVVSPGDDLAACVRRHTHARTHAAACGAICTAAPRRPPLAHLVPGGRTLAVCRAQHLASAGACPTRRVPAAATWRVASPLTAPVPCGLCGHAARSEIQAGGERETARRHRSAPLRRAAPLAARASKAQMQMRAAPMPPAPPGAYGCPSGSAQSGAHLPV
jgi:hypothetical protein